MEILKESLIQKEKFRTAANKLLNNCFIIKKKEDTRNDYIFIIQNKDLFIEYFDLLGYSKSKTKAPATIVQNFTPMKAGLVNKKNDFCQELMKLQMNYCNKYDIDFGSGYDEMQEYIKEHHKLVSSDIIKYEEDLQKAKENCHLEFRESFLARLRENIEDAKLEFKNLNAALKNIYYGEDSYKFELTHNKRKESICQMIMSRNNEIGMNLWSQSFEEEYKEEMEDLFAKLTAYDDKGEKVDTILMAMREGSNSITEEYYL